MATKRRFFGLSGLVAGVAAAAVLSTGGCAYSNGDAAAAPQPCEVSPQTVTYSGVIAPIMDKNCRSCHASNAASAFGGGQVLGDYETLRRYPSDRLLGAVKHAIGYAAMPQGQAKLSECDIRRIEAWIDAGKPQ